MAADRRGKFRGFASLTLAGSVREPPARHLPTTPYVWSIGELTLRRFNAAFQDEQVTPATNLQFGINDMTVRGIVGDPSNPDAPVSLVGHFRAPGIASTLTLEGSCRPFAAKQTLDLALTAGGVRPDALRPYLDAAGIQADLNSGTFTCQLSADVSASPAQSLVVNAELSKVRWADDKELLALDGVRISNLALSGDSIHVDSVAVVGPRFGVRREASGALGAAGFRRLVRPALANAAPANGASSPAVGPPAGALLVSPPGASGETEPPQKLPKIDITRFTWNGVKVQLDDQAASPPTSVSIEDAGLEITGIHVDFDPQSTAGSQGTIHAWLKAPGLAGTLKLDGMVQQGPAGMKADLTVTGDHLCADLAVPYSEGSAGHRAGPGGDGSPRRPARGNRSKRRPSPGKSHCQRHSICRRGRGNVRDRPSRRAASFTKRAARINRPACWKSAS